LARRRKRKNRYHRKKERKKERTTVTIIDASDMASNGMGSKLLLLLHAIVLAPIQTI
jgi:hypothetical protein